jgi:hypothetical protein
MEHPQISDRFVSKMLGKSENHPKMMVYHGFPIIFPSFSHHFLYDFMVISPKKTPGRSGGSLPLEATKAAATASWSAPCRGCARRDPGCRCNS